MEVEKPAEEFSKEELRRQLYSSLRSTGVLDSMKGQLRARLLEHLRRNNGESMEVKGKHGKPSMTERLLSSLFLDYLECNGFTFTISVFMPESQMASWRPFAYHEMLELLHLDPSSDLHLRLKGGEGRECLAHQLVIVLQQMAQRSCITEVSTQTSPAMEVCKIATRNSCTSLNDLEKSMKEVDDAYIRKQEAQRALPYRSLEDKITILHQEFDARVNAEVALQMSRLRDFEINAARMDEAARYRRQLARDREELEDIHKSRMDRIKAREESLLERMLSKEKAIEASAYEQRQKILTEITSLRERENKLRQFKESQERREEKLDERELSVRAKEEEVVHVSKSLCTKADEITALRKKELEEQYKERCDCLQHDRTLLEAEREQMKEEKVAMAIELAASRSDKELIQALHHRLRVEEDQRLHHAKLTRELEAKLEENVKQQRASAPTPVNISDQRLEERLRDVQFELEQERIQRQASEKESKTLERKLQQKKMELAAARAPQGEWITEHKNLMATIHQQCTELQKKETTLQLMEMEKEKVEMRHKKLLLKIDHLDTLVKNAQGAKDLAFHDLEILQEQHNITERELLETVTLLRKAKQALEAERLDHCALQSHQKTLVPSLSVTPQSNFVYQDKHNKNESLFELRPSADEIIRKKWESFQKKPRRESHDLWTRVLSDSAAKKLSHDQDLACIPSKHLSTSIFSEPLSSGFGYQFLEMHNNGSLLEVDEKLSWETNSETKSCDPTNVSRWKSITVEEINTVKEGITSSHKIAAVIETLVTGSLENNRTSSWDGDLICEDAIPSWRKTPQPEVARPGNWNNGHDEPESQSCMVTSRQSEFGIDVGNVTTDSGNAWNLGHSGDHSHKDEVHSMAFFREAEKMAENSDYQELLRSSLQGLGTSAETCVQQMHSPTATSPRGLKNSQEEMTLHMESFKGVTTTEVAQTVTATSTSEIVCNITSVHLDLENLQVSQSIVENGSFETQASSFPSAISPATMKEGSKEKEGAKAKEGSKGKEEDQTSAQGFSNIATTVENTDFEQGLKSPWNSAKRNVSSQPNEMACEERTNLEPTERGTNRNESLTVQEIESDTKEDDEHIQEEGAESSWHLYLGEEEASSRENSEAEDSLSQDTAPSCKCLASLKHDLEYSEGSVQSGDEARSGGEEHESADAAEAEVPPAPDMKPRTDNVRLSAESVDFKGEDDQHVNNRSETESKVVVEEDKTKQATGENEAREMDAGLLLPSDPGPESVKLTDKVHQIATDLTSVVPIQIENDEADSKHSPTLSVSDDASAQDPDKDFDKLMRCLGLAKEEQQRGSNEKEMETLSQKALGLENEDSRSFMYENDIQASGKLSGLPEMGDMLYKQEMQAKEKARNVLPALLQEDSAQDPPKKDEVNSTTNVNLASPQASKPPSLDKHALETLRTSIVVRKQELSESEKGSPRLLDWVNSPRSHPTLALAIRNNRLVKLETQGELEKTPRSLLLNPRHVEVEATINTKSSQDEQQFSSTETPHLVDQSSNVLPASETTPTPAPCGETQSGSEESIYQGDSFEEEEDEEEDDDDQEPAYSEESYTQAAVGESSEKAPGLKTNERPSPRRTPKVEVQESINAESSFANWEGGSEQGSYSPLEDDTVADLPV